MPFPKHPNSKFEFKRKKMPPPSETVRLNNGNEMPLVGLGTFAAELGGECREAVKTAILCGYRYILKNKS